MKPISFPARMLITSGCLATTGYASAHDGHEHVTATLQWADHSILDHALSDEFTFADTSSAVALDLAITSWKLSDGSTGYSTQDPQTNSVVSGVLADVNTVAYDSEYVYIRASGIPSHDIGVSDSPNPAKAGDLGATYRISLNPIEETGEKTETGLGAVGIMVNGVAFYNQSDGTYWNSQTNGLGAPAGGGPGGNEPTEVWTTNALWFRADGLDEAGGHSSPIRGSNNPDGSVLGRYHYHQTPYGLMEQLDPDNDGTMGSPIVGYAFDGYAVVGPYAYIEEVDGSLSVIQMTSSYGLEDNRGDDGPAIEDYELGSFLEDFVYFEGSGTLNEYNMAFVKFDEEGRAIVADETDQEGDWAYFLTLDVIDAISGNDTDIDGSVAFPYIVGPEYYGVVDTEFLDPENTISMPDNLTMYFEYVPEPSSIVFLGLGLGAISRRRRMRQM